MKDIENTKKEAPLKESPLLGLTGMGGGAASLMWAGASVVNGLLWMVGENQRGQLGNNDSELGAHDADVSSPIQIGTDETWAKIAVAQSRSAAVKSNGTMWSWGNDDKGELGLSDRGTERSSPTQLPGTTWSDVNAGRACFLATKTNNTLWSWGYSGEGQLGLNDKNARSSPTQIPGTTWTQPRNGGNHIGASGCLKTDGTLWTWGDNEKGMLGHNNTTNYSSPKQLGSDTDWNCFDICGGDSNMNAMMGVKNNGELWVWGYSEGGALGLNEGDVTYSTRQQVGTDTTWGTAAHQVAMGAGCAFAIKTDGTLWAWGENTNTALGVPGSPQSSPIQVGTDTNWSQVHCSEKSVIGLKTNNQLWVWGKNNKGQLGLGNKSEPPGPRQFPTTGKYYTEIDISGETLGAVT